MPAAINTSPAVHLVEFITFSAMSKCMDNPEYLSTFSWPKSDQDSAYSFERIIS